jgi:hypothetical protein
MLGDGYDSFQRPTETVRVPVGFGRDRAPGGDPANTGPTLDPAFGDMVHRAREGQAEWGPRELH